MELEMSRATYNFTGKHSHVISDCFPLFCEKIASLSVLVLEHSSPAITEGPKTIVGVTSNG